MNTAPPRTQQCHLPRHWNKTSVRQLLDGQEYPVAKVDIIKKGFGRESSVERCVAYLHGICQLPGCPRYTCDIITLCTWLKLLPIEKNAMLVAAKFIVDFRGMHFKSKKALHIIFQKHASIFRKSIPSTINGGGHGWYYVLPTSMCANTNNYFPMEDRYSGLI